MRILLVDDHEVVSEGIALLLKQIDSCVSVFCAKNYSKCLAWLAREQCDLILFDLGLPDCVGIEALKELKALHGMIPVVVLSGQDNLETIHAALSCGAMGFVPKTSSSAIMFSALQRVLAGGVYVPSETMQTLPSKISEYPNTAKSEHQGTIACLPVAATELGLTDRQFDVLKLLIKGLPNKLISRQLDISEATVKAHVSGVLRVLNVTSRTQAVFLLSQKGVLLSEA